MLKKTDDTRLLFTFSFFGRRKDRLLRLTKKWLKEGKSVQLVYTPNPEQIIQSRGNQQFEHTLKMADLLLPDGVGLVWASQWLAFLGKAKPIKERIAGADVAQELIEQTAQLGLKTLIIGGRDYGRGDQLIINGQRLAWTPGYAKISQPTLSEEKKVVSLIKKLKPSLVLVAFGAPHQEFWLDEHRELLEKNKVKIGMAVGGSIDYLLGIVPRAPGWMQQLGLEWLFRLIRQPWRFKRQLRLLKFIGLTIDESCRKL